MSKEAQRFCTRPSRLFSGAPDALFTPDSSFYSIGTVLQANLTSPFSFQLDTDQVPDTQFWNISRIFLNIFCPNNNVSGLSDNEKHLYLMPNNLVGTITDAGDLAVFNPNNVGVEIRKTASDTYQAISGAGGNSLFFEEPILVPPRWFLRLAFLDLGAGTVLNAGTIITLRMLRQVIPNDFSTQY